MHSGSQEFEKDELATPDEAISQESKDLASNEEKQDQPQQNESTAPLPPPDGGYGWVCTACCATINAHTWGMSFPKE